ncbi:hypothetical protein [Salarchaeum japonicum]|uniref:Transcription factor zinc-finger domain-containing protein n=1 Tax=Salarchaeum japonicum TaxID=555573 RepID=A0AAV3T0Z8_9EURY|nr:hypothetical protein [Salarchaeum japonicum]
MTQEFVRASQLRTDGGAEARRQDYWEQVADDAPSADACAMCSADGPDCRRVRLPDRDERVALCRPCRGLWGGQDE